MRIVRIALAQVNTTVGDLEGNAVLVLRGIAAAREAKADLVVFPELTLTGYPPEDLVLRRQFIDDNLKVLKEVVEDHGSRRRARLYRSRGGPPQCRGLCVWRPDRGSAS